MGTDDVADLKFAGGKYDQYGFPLDGIRELQQYQRLVLEAAKQIWRAAHPKALKLPPNFPATVRLRIKAVEPGSNFPILEREARIAVGGADLLDLSIALVDSMFEAIVGELTLPIGTSGDLAFAARQFGSSFEDNEGVTFRARSSRPITYTADTRRRFITALNEAVEIREGLVVGTVRMLDTAQEFILVDSAGRPIPGKFTSDDIFDELHEVHGLRNQADLVWLDCAYEFDSAAGSITTIRDVRQAGLFAKSSSRWAAPLARIASYQPGWSDGEGSTIGLTAILTAFELLEKLETFDRLRPALPSVFGDPEGGVRIEWLEDNSHTVIVFDEDASFSFYQIDLAAGSERFYPKHSGVDAAIAFLAGVAE